MLDLNNFQIIRLAILAIAEGRQVLWVAVEAVTVEAAAVSFYPFIHAQAHSLTERETLQ